MQQPNVSDPDPPARPLHQHKLRFASQPSIHLVPREDLSLAMVYSLLATVMQFVSLGILCVAASLKYWIFLEPQKNSVGSTPLVLYMFGIPYKMNASGNITDAQYLYFFGKGQDVIQPAMIALCFLSLCSGVTAFLLDYMQVQMPDKYGMTLVPGLHVSSGVFTMVLIAICVSCYEKINHMVKEPEWKQFQIYVYFGESFYVGLLAFACEIWAAAFSLCSVMLSREQEEPSENPDGKQ